MDKIEGPNPMQNSHPSDRAVGLDFGTTNSAVALSRLRSALRIAGMAAPTFEFEPVATGLALRGLV